MNKTDIFSVHNKGVKKRAAADEAAADSQQQVHQTSDTIGDVDAATLSRSRRRMEEKAQIYEELRKGHHLAADSSDEEDERDEHAARLRRKERNALVDFDRKWAEEEAEKEEEEDDEVKRENEDDTESLVEYEDEFGRTRKGTRAEAERAARMRADELVEEDGLYIPARRARPARPEKLIYGETIQTQAFNPDDEIAAKMSYLASRRDRSVTPPEETHYNADSEVRTRGTGFYAFSQDAKERERQMAELLNARKETEREREERRQRQAERQRLKEERRQKIRELRSRRQAESFLEGLGSAIA